MEARKYIDRIIPHYITHRNYIGKGNAEAMALRHIVQIVLIAKVAYSELPTWLLIIAGLALVFCFWLIGYTWDKWKAYHMEAEWGNKRNPFCKTVEEKLNGNK